MIFYAWAQFYLMLYSHALLKTDDDGISVFAMVQHDQSDWLSLQKTLPNLVGGGFSNGRKNNKLSLFPNFTTWPFMILVLWLSIGAKSSPNVAGVAPIVDESSGKWGQPCRNDWKSCMISSYSR
mgnify:CR=1 FL=1